jgi:hypothetical protein
MNAVLDKSRAKAKPKAAKSAVVVQQPKIGIADIRSWIRAADEKLEAVYDAAERGEPLDVLLDHLNHSVLCNPIAIIHREDLTQADVKRLYTALFPVLACLQGAIKLAEGTVLQHSLGEAFALLDAAQTALDPVNDAVRALPEGGLPHDFERGRDIAIKMIHKGSALTGEKECYRRYRDPGIAQNNFVYDHLLDIIDHPELRAGFASVLSQMIGSSESFDGNYFTNLTFAETRARDPGEDGTQSMSDAASAEGDALLSPYSAEFAFDAHCRVTEAQAILDSRMHELNSGAAYGALTLTTLAKAKVAAVQDHATTRACEEASGALHEAIEVLSIFINDQRDPVAEGAHTLLVLAKQLLDDNVGALL